MNSFLMLALMAVCYSMPCAAMSMSAATTSPPEQIHIALGSTTGSMTVTFITIGGSGTIGSVKSSVELKKLDGTTSTVAATQSSYTAGGWVGLVHTAELAGLEGEAFSYRCAVNAETFSEWIPVDYFARIKGGHVLCPMNPASPFHQLPPQPHPHL